MRAAKNAEAAGDTEAYNEAVNRANGNGYFLIQDKKAYDFAIQVVRESEQSLKTTGYFVELTSLQDEYTRLQSDLNSLLVDVESFANDLVADASTFYTDIETDLVSTLSPLTGFDETDVTDQELVSEIQPVQPPSDLTTLDPNISSQAEDIAREEFAKVAQGEEVAALPAVAIPAAANVLTRTAIQAAPAVVRKITQFAANDPRFAQAVVENPYIQELLRAASLTAALGPNGELLINPIIQQNESAAESARLYRYATQVQKEVANIPQNVVNALEREVSRFEELALQEDIENFLAPQPDMAVELVPETIGQQPVVEVDVTQPVTRPRDETAVTEVTPVEDLRGLDLLDLGIVQRPGDFVEPAPSEVPETLPPVIFEPLPEEEPLAPVVPAIPREPEVLPPGESERAPGVGPGTERLPTDLPLGRPEEDVNIGIRPEDQTGLLPGTRPEQKPETRPVQELEPAVRPEEPSVPPRITDDEIIDLITRELEPSDEELPPEEVPGEDDEDLPELPEEPTEELPEEPPEEPPAPPPPLPPPVVTTVARQQFTRPTESAPYRVTGQDESGILGRKQPLFGGDDDLQRAEWNRRSLRLRRLLGL
jgi:hypothetical protein